MATIDDLVRLVPPPEAPVDATGDWEQVETDLGLELPSDFKTLIQRYGRGQFESFITPLMPFGKHAMLIDEARRLQEDDQSFRDEHPEISPYAFYPDPGGLLPWAGTDNGDRLCWLTEGRPDTWTTVTWNPRAWDYDAHAVGATAFLHGWLTGRISDTVLGDCNDAQPWFDPYRELSHVYLKLSEGELPYSERLRILREALAPTADRCGYQHANSRQDHFVATALGWRLTYENAYGHQIRVSFPPEDEDRARRTMLDAAARMGCRVLTLVRMKVGQSTNLK
jgi:SMI1-KNR4 cell-wall